MGLNICYSSLRCGYNEFFIVSIHFLWEGCDFTLKAQKRTVLIGYNMKISSLNPNLKQILKVECDGATSFATCKLPKTKIEYGVPLIEYESGKWIWGSIVGWLPTWRCTKAGGLFKETLKRNFNIGKISYKKSTCLLLHFSFSICKCLKLCL